MFSLHAAVTAWRTLAILPLLSPSPEECPHGRNGGKKTGRRQLSRCPRCCAECIVRRGFAKVCGGKTETTKALPGSKAQSKQRFNRAELLPSFKSAWNMFTYLGYLFTDSFIFHSCLFTGSVYIFNTFAKCWRESEREREGEREIILPHCVHPLFCERVGVHIQPPNTLKDTSNSRENCPNTLQNKLYKTDINNFLFSFLHPPIHLYRRAELRKHAVNCSNKGSSGLLF